MHIKISREELVSSLTHAASVATTRNTIPVLSYGKLSISNEGAFLTSTDLESRITAKIEVEEAIKGGETLLPIHGLLDIAKKLKKGALVDIKASNTALTVTCERYATILNILDVSDFPEWTANDFDCTFSIAPETLSDSLHNVSFAISSEETRYYLCGVHIHTDGEKLKFVATDGHRLALSRVVKPEMTGEMPEGVIVPRSAVNNVMKLCVGSDTMTVSLNSTRARFNFGGIVFETKLIDGMFPEYRRVIPQGNTNTIRVKSSVLNDAVQRVAAVSKERSRPVKFDVSGNELKLSCSADGNSSEDSIEVSGDSDDITIGFQARYVSDVLTLISGDVICKFSDSAGPSVILDDRNDDVLFVLMPMRV